MLDIYIKTDMISFVRYSKSQKIKLYIGNCETHS